MFDTMTLTKVVGGFCGAFLVFLLGGWAAETIYHVGGSGHDGEEHAAYVIETDEGEGGGEEEAPADFATLWQSRDEGAGERVFNQCRACHQLEEGANAVGPYLYGVVGRDVGTAEGFNYSGALSEAADVWTAENLFHFLENPQGYASGTSMSYSGLSSAEDRVNLIAYLNTFDGNAQVEAPAETGGEDEAAAEGESGESSEEASAEGADGEETQTAEASDGGDASEGGEGGGSEVVAMVDSADASAGENVFNRCRACHKVDGSNGVGPHLDGVVGRDIGSVEGFNYSGALSEQADVWTVEHLFAFLENPREWAPGTAMSYAGLRSEEDRANLIAYLQTLSE